MATHTTRTRAVTALLITFLSVSLADMAMGQSRMSNPRFHRRVTTQFDDRQSSDEAPQSAGLKRRSPPSSGVSARGTAKSLGTASGNTALQHRATQALWHAQSERERKAVSRRGSAETPQSFGYRPKHERLAGAPVVPGAKRVVNLASHDEAFAGELINGDEVWSDGPHAYYDGAVIEGETFIEGEGVWEGDASYEFADDLCECDGGCLDCVGELPPGSVYFMGDLTVFAGVQGFTNPLNEGVSGSFGFHEGFNLGTALPFFPHSNCGFQIGVRSLQSNLSGSGQTTEERHQTYFTTGVFRRADWGWQAGLVIDVLDDDWVGDVDLTQVRGEISWRSGNVHELGYWFAASGDDDTTSRGLLGPLDVTVGDVQGFFYRHQSMSLPGATGRVLVGFSNDADALLAAEAQVPMSARLSLLSSATYLIPEEPTGAGGAENEAWNIGLSVIFSFRGSSSCSSAPFAPLFPVADNGVFFVNANRRQ